MKVYSLHSWDVGPIEAKIIQNRLRRKLVLRDDYTQIKTIAGVHTYHDLKTGIVQTGVVVQSYPDLQVLETRISRAQTSFPYVPGLLSFREGPSIILALEQLGIKPDMFIFSGHGYSHPRRLGLASHMGIILDSPSIGVARSKLWGKFDDPSLEAGSFSYLLDEKEIIGIVYRHMRGQEPIFVSVGHRISLMSALEVVMPICRSGFPEPLQQATTIARSV